MAARKWTEAQRQAQRERMLAGGSRNLNALRQSKLGPTMPQAQTVSEEETPTLHVLPGVNGNSNARSRFKWNHEEWKQLANEIAAHLRKQGLRHAPQQGDRTGTAILVDAALLAQHDLIAAGKLGKDRKKTDFFTSTHDFFKLLEEALTAWAEPQPTQPKHEPAPVQAQLPPVAAPEAPGPAPEPAAGGVGKLPLRELVPLVMGRFLSELEETKQLAEMLLEENQGLRSAFDGMTRRIAVLETESMNAARAPAEVLTKVAIIGCRRDEFDHIKRKAEENGLKLEFRLYEQGTKPRPVHADYAICLKWAGHAQWDHALNEFPKGRFIFLHGGVSMAVDQLRTWFPKQ